MSLVQMHGEHVVLDQLLLVNLGDEWILASLFISWGESDHPICESVAERTLDVVQHGHDDTFGHQ